MKHGSLFSGIGGFDLAAEWMGWENVFHCEWNEFGKKILKYYWPNAKSYSDITKTDFSIHRGTIDIISGGFPCQPYSVAGSRKGKADDRHLWPEMLRAIREVQPRWIVGENVPGLLNWERGMVLDEIKASLEAEGFEVLPPLVLPACAVNANHRRDRLWIVAHSSSNGYQRRGFRKDRSTERQDKSKENKWERVWNDIIGNGEKEIITNPERIRQQRPGRPEGQIGTKTNSDWKASWSDSDGGWPTQSPVCSGDDGIPAGLDYHSISKSNWRKESLMGAGNAIVPQVALEIFKAIEQCI